MLQGENMSTRLYTTKDFKSSIVKNTQDVTRVPTLNFIPIYNNYFAKGRRFDLLKAYPLWRQQIYFPYNIYFTNLPEQLIPFIRIISKASGVWSGTSVSENPREEFFARWALIGNDLVCMQLPLNGIYESIGPTIDELYLYIKPHYNILASMSTKT